MRFVVIGADAAGMSAASRAKRRDPDLEVVVFDKTMDVSYSACGMPYNIADPNREIDDLVVRQADVFRNKQGLDLRLNSKVVSIDRKLKQVRVKPADAGEYEFSYDKLMIATGASPLVPGVPGADLPGIFVLKSLQDGRYIKRFLEQRTVKRVLILGMGYIALEMADALRQRDFEVALVKPRVRILPWMHEQLADTVRNQLEKNQVEVHAGNAIEAIQSDGESFEILCAGLDLKADMLLVAAGVKPNSRIAQECGLSIGPNRSISVDRFMQTSDENVYSAGDCADSFHVVTDQKTWMPLALHANRGGWAVADNVTGGSTELPGVVGSAVFKVFDLEVAKCGLSMDEANENGFNPKEVVIQSRSRGHSHPGSVNIQVHMLGDAKSGMLLGAQMVGAEGVAHRINAVAVALHNRMSVHDFSQTDLAYAPPFGPVWDPLLTAANRLKRLL